jgi:hypothetical protein
MCVDSDPGLLRHAGPQEGTVNQGVKPRNKTYACACGLQMARPYGKCRSCEVKARAERSARTAAARATTKKTRRTEREITDSLRTSGRPTIQIADGERWSLQAVCTLCHKPILIQGRCYACSTGNPRTVLRADEREAVAA